MRNLFRHFSKLVIFGSLLQFFNVYSIHGQQLSDSIRKKFADNINHFYFEGIGNNAEIYHGRQYIRNGTIAKGFPFFESDSMIKGYVNYQGLIYSERDVYYDIVQDVIIISNFANNALIALSPQKVSSFTIDNHFFIQLIANSANGLPITGYYDQLYSGEASLFARRDKKLVMGLGSDENKYIPRTTYYIRLKGVYYLVNNRKDLLNTFKDQEDGLKKFIRSSKLNFKKNLESSLLSTTVYYSEPKK